ncbi:Abnormal spindle-like microcephaly-assoc'd, ASPM-SPD-2-Hydin [Amycolatopsis xylanica]|uniref:Abnormal spindle-like microcephaly-assoc'd, ASPM-SPD-2-Hydin n=1 Tax=Amycolatopsis xylanica TaxID=589385 RepID=A0A1H3M6J8_9PSEU|nr:hypothetical protein [Amycolatopsis xylanica]SDY72350.1 Abnormal spindle-like microcephaly-assoc'd, ASPM-SPD-2-Hydin [Amycolatopsis xylanica]
MAKKEKPAPKPNTALEVLAAMIGSTLVLALTLLVTKTNAPVGVQLAGAAVGAAIPPFVGTVGPRRHLRVAFAGMVAIVAVSATCLTGVIVGKATDSALLPLPPSIPILGRSTTPTTQGKSLLEASPSGLACTQAGCPGKVTIKNSGETSVQLIDIESSAEKTRFKVTGDCANKTLQPAQKCALAVSFTPVSTDTTVTETLVVRTLPSTAEVRIVLIGTVKTPPLDLTVDKAALKCEYSPGQLKVTFRLTPTGASPVTGIGATVVNETTAFSLSRTVNAGPSPQPPTTVTLPVPVGSHPRITISVDPGNAVKEADESNNRLQLTPVIPATTSGVPKTVSCG